MNKILKTIIIFVVFIITFAVKSFSKYSCTKIIKAYEISIRNENKYNDIEKVNDEEIQIIQIIR